LAAYELEDDVLANFVEFSLANAVFHALAEGHASEMAARRTAMENATKNAGMLLLLSFVDLIARNNALFKQVKLSKR
jgi:F0F1-type ATP synthase gamma subunit